MKSSIIKEKKQRNKNLSEQNRLESKQLESKEKNIQKMTETKPTINDDNEYKWVIPLS